ncbi:hypothetical protein ACXZ1K_05645 [Pedobacter sp. PWIIR3]
MTEKYGSYYRMISVLVDLALINLAGYFAYLFAYWPEHHIDMNHINMVHVLLVNFIWFNVTQITRLYRDIFIKDAIPTVRQSFMSLVLFSVFICALVYLIPEFTFTNDLILYMLVVFTPLFLGERSPFYS